MSDFGYGQLEPEDTATEFGVICFIVRQMIAELSTVKVVQVKKVTNEGGVSAVGYVDVHPLVNQVDGNNNATPHGTIHNIPYFRLQGGANAVIIDPQVDDIGYMVCSDRDISAVKASKKESNPGSLRRFDLADGIYVGGILNGVPTQYIRFFSGGVEIKSGTKITMDAPTIELKGAVTGDSTAAFTGAVTAEGVGLKTHHHISGSAGNPTGPALP